MVSAAQVESINVFVCMSICLSDLDLSFTERVISRTVKSQNFD